MVAERGGSGLAAALHARLGTRRLHGPGPLACLCLVLLLAACARDAEPAPAAPADAPVAAAPARPAQVAAPAAPVDALSTVDDTVAGDPAAAAGGFDRKAFAGRFVDVDGTTLQIDADGAFGLRQGATEVDGTWTLQADGAHLLLDPHSKSEPDQRWRLVDHDHLQRVGEAPLDLRRSR